MNNPALRRLPASQLDRMVRDVAARLDDEYGPLFGAEDARLLLDVIETLREDLGRFQTDSDAYRLGVADALKYVYVLEAVEDGESAVVVSPTPVDDPDGVADRVARDLSDDDLNSSGRYWFEAMIEDFCAATGCRQVPPAGPAERQAYVDMEAAWWSESNRRQDAADNEEAEANDADLADDADDDAE